MAINVPKEITINNFGGVDLSSPTFQANSARAVNSVNFLKKDGINQKRKGLTNVLTLDSDSQNQIKGFFSFTDSTGIKRNIFCFGDKLLLTNNLSADKEYFEANYTSHSYVDGKDGNDFIITTNDDYIPGWVAGDRLYLLIPGSDYVVVYYDEEEEKLIAESLPDNFDLTYIPLTRFAIAAEGSPADYAFGIAYDDVNMLTQWKKNSFRTGTFTNISTQNPNDSSFRFVYQLDSKVNFKEDGTNYYDLVNLKIDYLDTTAQNPVESLSWLSWYNSPLIIPAPLSGSLSVSGTFKQLAYTTSGVGRFFKTTDTLISFKYYPATGYPTSAPILETGYYNLDGFTVDVYYDSAAYPYGTYPFPIQANVSNRVVIDLRKAVDDGYLAWHSNLANGHVEFTVTSGALGGAAMDISVYTPTFGTPSPVYYVAKGQIFGTVLSPEEYAAFEVKKTLDLNPSLIGTESMTFTTDVGGVSTIVAYVFYGNDETNGTLVIPYNSSDPVSFLHQSTLNDFIPPTLGLTNMTLTFPFYVDGYSQRVTNNKFGKLFGYNGARNRLFLGGNPDYKNVLYHSYNTNFYNQEPGDIVPSNNDLTYFSDLEYNIVGSEDNEITGLEVLYDNKLLVMKRDNKEDSTIHTIQATTIGATAYDGSSVTALDGSQLQEELYIADTGNIGDGLDNWRLITTLNGDTLFLSKLGLRGVVSQQNLPSAPKKSVPRSSLIDKILRQDVNYFNQACMTTHNGKLYLYVNGTIYVADEDYIYDDGKDNQYEWWVLRSKEVINGNVSSYEGFDIKNFFELDGELYFYDRGQNLNEQGDKYRNRIFKFVENQYVDKEVWHYPDGNLTYAIDDETSDTTIVAANELIFDSLTTSKKIVFYEPVYSALLRGVGYNGTTISMKAFGTGWDYETTQDEIFNGKVVKITKDPNGMFQGENVVISDLTYNASTQTYSMKLLYGGTPIDGALYVVAEILSAGTELEIKDLDDSINEFKLVGKYNRTIHFIHYFPPESLDRRFFVISKENVSASYITSPFNFGSLSDLKTITKFVIANDTREDSYVEIYYLASNNTDVFKTITNTNNQLNLSNFSFQNVYFGSVNLPLPFTIRTNTRNVHSIMFKFYNNTDSNCILTNFSMLYYVTRKVR